MASSSAPNTAVDFAVGADDARQTLNTAATEHGISADEQRERYLEDGYLVFPKMFCSGDVAGFQDALAEVLASAEGIFGTNEKFCFVPADKDGSQVVRRIFNPIAHHRTFLDLALNPKILDVVENLIGPNIQIHHTKLNLKPLSRRAAFEWHQDYAFLPHSNFDLVAVMVTFDDATEGNGCLRVIPGSHKLGPLDHVFNMEGAATSRISDSKVTLDQSRWKSVPMLAGTMEVHHCNLIHGSEPSSADSPRAAMVIQYRAADNAQVAGSTDYYGYGMQVRGTNPHRVRMIEGYFQSPVVNLDLFGRRV